MQKASILEEAKVSKLGELLQEGKYEELWQRCCGFIDLSLNDFMAIQRRLLAEQLELLDKCELGRTVMKGASPQSLEEFREQVSLTTYSDYAPFLLEKKEAALPRKPVLWQYTSGKYGEYSFRWAPVSAEQLEAIKPTILALTLFASCQDRGSLNIREGDKVLYGMAPPPYATGTMARALPNDLFTFLPPIEQAEKLSFEDRISQGFRLALAEGLDICFALSSVAVAIGERFAQRGRSTNVRSLLRRPRALFRLAKGLIKSKLAHRPLLPRDLWPLKGLITFGIDGSIYREKIKQMWGRYPLDFHGCTEAPLIAMQTWDYQGMTFVPNLNLLEFIPEEEIHKSEASPLYQPKTLLIDEIVPGNYELVITSFHGGPFIRYRLGHLIQITARRNQQLKIDIPQMRFLTRIDDQIDIAGFTRLSEKVIWQAIENSGIPYEEWTVRKETEADKPVLHLYIELKGSSSNGVEDVSSAIHEELKKLDKPYAELQEITGLKPLQVTVLPQSTFYLFKLRQQRSGADLGHLRPPHLNPSEQVLDSLLSAAPGVTVTVTERPKVTA